LGYAHRLFVIGLCLTVALFALETIIDRALI